LITPIARFAVRYSVPVLIGWALVVVVFGLIGRGVEDKVQPSLLFIPGTESDRWREERSGSFNEGIIVLLVGPQRQVDAQGPRLAAALAKREGTRAVSPWSGAGEELASLRPSPREAVINVDLAIPEGENINTVIGPLKNFVSDHVRSPVRAHLAGIPSLGSEVNEASIDALHKGELIAAPMLILVLLLVFRSPIAAAIPLAIAIGTVATANGIISLVLEFKELDAVALSAASMIGLALGVDYSLLIVTRFRESLAHGHVPRQAASIAANTAGRTANFAGLVLLAIIAVAFFLSPGTILLSMALGMSVVTVLSMVGAIVVTPAAVSLIGERVNMWQIGGAPSEGGGAIGRVVDRVSRRPLLAASMLGAMLLLLAAPVSAIETTPADPRVLPEDSDGLAAFYALRRAGFGPEIDIALIAPQGTLLDPGRLEQIQRLERRVARMPLVGSVTGLGVIADETADIRSAPAQVARSRRDLRRAEDELAGRARQLTGAQRAARAESASLARDLGRAETLLASSRSLLGEASGRTSDVESLVRGLTVARDGASQLASGTGTLRGQARLLADALGQIRTRVDNLVPAIESGQSALREAQARLNVLRAPSQVTTRELENALAALDRADASDPQVQQARRHVTQALEAASGRDASTGAKPAAGYQGIDAALTRELTLASAAGKQVDDAVRTTRQFADVMRQVADGAGRLVTPGLGTIEGGQRELAQALGQARDRVVDVQPELERLATGAEQLLAGGEGLLAAGGARAAPLLTDLQGGLADASSRISGVRRGLRSQSGPFAPLREIDRLERDSPGFFKSGYVVAAGLEGARPIQRDAIAAIVDAAGGGRKARIIVLPDVPTNDPRQDRVVDDIRAEARDFARRTGMSAPVGGTAPELTDFARVNSSRVPLIILAICLVTYLALVPILRSVVLPAIAVGLNMLTVATAFGVLTLLFVGDDPPMGGAGELDVVTVTGIFVVTFALSIDYQVFLLTRMREEYVRTQSHAAAIEFGIAKTARVVTGAAAIMIAVFTAFALSSFSLIQQLGVGLAVAVLIDATIVRLGLLPAIMKLAGDRAWWIPGWLDARLPMLDTEGAIFERDAGHVRRAAGL
jgi:RND superfamily putative drug exporter